MSIDALPPNASAEEEKKEATPEEEEQQEQQKEKECAASKPIVQWTPTLSSIESSQMTKFLTHVNSTRANLELSTYADLYAWSIAHSDDFWSAFFDFSGLVASTKGTTIRTKSEIFYKNRFFPDAELNYAENLLQYCPTASSTDDAIVFWGEDKVKARMSYPDLYDSVSRLAAYLRTECDLQPGDRVAGFVPNTPSTIIAILATASIGGVWSSCSPDFGVSAVLDRFGQIQPKLLFSADGYYYNGKTFDCLDDKLPQIVEGLKDSVERVIVFPYAGSSTPLDDIPKSVSWKEAMGDVTAPAPELIYEQVPFDHPLFILFSSGTTGVPKCIVHSVGGTLIQHMKEHQVHCNVDPKASGEDRHKLFYFTTCGWMMWNWQVTALASGATLMLYDGSPFAPTPTILFDYAQEERCTLFGTSAKYIDALNKFGARPIDTHDLSSIKIITSTGSPLVPESFDYVYSSIKKDVNLASISGGTDIVSCFVLGNPVLPVHRGEIQNAGLGMDVDVFDENGKPVVGRQGELVCKSPFPSMPIGFWGDVEDKKFKSAYFDRFDNIWCHGDFIEKNDRNGFVIYGRSDTTLNPCGVRIGTAEIYRQVEKVDDVLESIVVGQQWKGDERIVLFVKLRDGLTLDDDLRKQIKTVIRVNTSPRHCPAVILQVSDIPRTKSGKITEIAVRDVIHGREIKNDGALANPEALEHFKGREELVVTNSKL